MSEPLRIVTKELKQELQTAIEIELSTLPIYLYTYYSINRTPDQNKIIADLTNKAIDAGKSAQAADQYAQRVSVDIMVHANKAGATIMSVAVEEMLHMALACNLKRALVGMPELSGKSPAQYPAQLPGQAPGLNISLSGYSVNQLDIFKRIELPEKADPAANKSWETIGEFYGWIIDHLKNEVTPEDYEQFRGLPQLGPGKGYYATNNVNTVYYDRQHHARYANHDDSGDLVLVVDNDTALQAIQIIVDQGEGHEAVETPFDDPDDKEESHYFKYCSLRDELAQLDPALLPYFVKPVPENPTTASYPPDIQTVSNLLNAVYTYLFMMTEACYRHEIPKQNEIFNFGMHKGMIFILSTLCDAITSLPLPWGGVAAPTFENYQFSPATSAKSQLLALYQKIPASLNPNPNVLQRLGTLPDMDILTKEMLSFA
jgi:hypothetical protein